MCSGTSCADLALLLVLLGLTQGAVIALSSVGLTLVYGATRTVNLAHGDVFGLSGVIGLWVIRLAMGVLPPVLLVPATLAASCLIGALVSMAVERLAFRPFRERSPLVPLIATVAVSFMLYQIALLWPVQRSIPPLLPQFILLRFTSTSLDLAFRVQDVIVLLAAIVLVVATTWFLQHTRHGRGIQAWSHDPEMAQLCGVHRTRTIQLVFGLAGVLIGVGAWAFVLLERRPVQSYGLESGLLALTAVVLGGIGRPQGALLGGLAIGVIATVGEAFRRDEWTLVVLLVLLILVLMLRPGGLGSPRPGSDDVLLDEQGFYADAPANQPAWKWIGWGCLALAIGYPLLDQALGLRQQVQLINLLFYVLLALGMTISLGMAGVLNLGYAACFALGAYTAAMLTTTDQRITVFVPHVEPFVLVLAISAAIAGLAGWGMSSITRRMQSGYVAVVTLACGQILQRLAVNLRQWTGGRDGMAVLPPPNLFGYRLQTPNQWYWLMLAAVTVATLICARLFHSRQGRAWRAFANDSLAAASSGVPIGQARRSAIMFGTAMAGATGALYASIIRFVDPGRADFLVTVLVVAMVVIGGSGSIVGAMLGALLVAGIDQVAIPFAGAWLERLAERPGWGWADSVDVRALNLLTFGALLYLALLIRTRRR